MRVDKPDDCCDEGELDGEMEAVEYVFETRVGLPFVAELHADVGECVAPRPGADEGVSVKAELRHASEACGQRDEGADDGEQAAKQDGDSAEALKEVLGAVKIVAA